MKAANGVALPLLTDVVKPGNAHKMLPPDAQAILMRAAATAGEAERAKAIDQAYTKIMRMYPNFFRR